MTVGCVSLFFGRLKLVYCHIEIYACALDYVERRLNYKLI